MVTIAKIARVRTGLGLGEFAQKHGFPITTVCQVEKGRMVVPLVWRQRYADALGLPLNELCDEHGWPRWEQPRSRQLQASA
jgi:hypothetical protein